MRNNFSLADWCTIQWPAMTFRFLSQLPFYALGSFMIARFRMCFDFLPQCCQLLRSASSATCIESSLCIDSFSTRITAYGSIKFLRQMVSSKSASKLTLSCENSLLIPLLGISHLLGPYIGSFSWHKHRTTWWWCENVWLEFIAKIQDQPEIQYASKLQVVATLAF